MSAIFKTTQYPIKTLIDDIHYGKIALPDIQRPFVWKPTQVRDLFDSIYEGFPTGYLLFWDNASESNTRDIGIDRKTADVQSLIIDGQQRLTALFSTIKGIPVMTDDFEKKHIRIAFNPLEEKFEVTNPAIERSTEYIADVSKLFVDDFSEYSFVNAYFEKLNKDGGIGENERSRIAQNINKLRSILNYQFTILEISSDIDEEAVANIFVRVNSKGVVLKQADFVLTLLSVFWEDGRKQIEDFCIETRRKSEGISAFNHLVDADPDEILKSIVGYGFRRGRMRDIYSLLRGRNFATRKFEKELQGQRMEQLKRFTSEALDNTTWHDYITLIQSLGFKHQDLITSKTNFFYSYTFYLIGKYEFGLSFRELESIISRWFIFGAITSRYSGSSETVFDGDLTEVRGLKSGEKFIKNLSDRINSILTNDYWEVTAPSNIESSSARNPLALIFTAAQIKNNVPVLFSDKKLADLFDPVITSKKKRLDRHHIFPKAYLESIGMKERTDQNQVANMIYLDYKTNIDISKKPPKEYFPLLMHETSINEERLKDHAVPADTLNLDYKDFLEKRRVLMTQYLKKYFQSF